MFREFFSSVKLLIWILAFLVILSFLFPLSSKREVLVEFHRGETLREFAEKLKDEGIIRSEFLFLQILKLLGKDKTIPSGIYILQTTRSEILTVLSVISQKPYPIMVRITIPPGRRIYDVPRILKTAGLNIDSLKFVNLCTDTLFISKLSQNFPRLKGLKSLEGFLYPDTYLIDERADEEEILKLFVENFFRKWNEFSLDSLLEKQTLPFYDVIKLASIVEKEAVKEEEKPIIASVYLNRLKRGMLLQANPTLWYVMNRSAFWLTYKDLRMKTPYNTYMFRGLPPTPICSPHISTIIAVLKPAKTNYLYFVADGKGGHIFSRTYREHLKNVRRMKKLWKSRRRKN